MTMQTTMTTQDERPVQDEPGDVQGYAVPAGPIILLVADVIAIGLMGMIGFGSHDHEPIVWGSVGNKI